MSVEQTTTPYPPPEAQPLVPLFSSPIGRVALMTDSVAQLPAEMAQRWGITIVPLAVIVGTEKYLDGVDLAPSELYRRMRIDKVLPTTSAPSLGQYVEAYRACLRAGAQSVLCVSLSSRLSTAYGVACQAAETVRAQFPDRAIEVLDSRQGAISEGFIALAAARAAADDQPLESVIQRARDAMPRAAFVAAFATLEYLARGGRIGKAAYWMGSLINVKPLITLDAEGLVAPVARVRGEDRALRAMVEWTARRVRGNDALSLAVMEADAPEAAARLRELALREMRPVEIIHSDFTPVMGVHTGPGLVGLGYYYEPDR